MGEYKSGFISIIGKPNAGKSTLLNALLEQKLSVINPKVQTTRHRILGIITDSECQMVFSDTPGVVQHTQYKLHERMMHFVQESWNDADILLLLHDAEDPRPDEDLVAKAKQASVPVLLVLNKVDISSQEHIPQINELWEALLPGVERIFISALHSYNIDLLKERIKALLPVSPPYYPDGQITDKTERFFISEIIRGNMLSIYNKEIPYCAEVQVAEFKDEPTITRIKVFIVVERESQKGIVIGHQGKKLKELGTRSRKEMETFLDRKVFLEMVVKVDPDWRNNELFLDRSGYV